MSEIVSSQRGNKPGQPSFWGYSASPGDGVGRYYGLARQKWGHLQNPRILLLSPVPLTRGTSGTKLRGMVLASGLSNIGSLKVLCFGETHGEPGDCPLPPGPRFWERLLSPVPSLFRCFQSEPFSKLVQHEARQFDVCFCLGLQMYQYAHCLPPGMPVVLDNYNVESDILWGLSRRRKGLKRLYWAWQALKLQRFERRALRRAGLVLAISSQDARGFQRLVPKVRVKTVPLGLDLTAFLAIDERSVPGRIVFVGALDWHVNIDACQWLAREVFPKIRARTPGATLRLVGHSPKEEVLALQSLDGVTVHPNVPEVTSYLAEASLIVVPLRYGSGVQTKVIQGLAAGRALVTTPVGLEGLDLVSGTHLLIGSNTTEMAEQCIRVLDDQRLAHELGRNGRLAVAELYSTQRLQRDLEDVCASLG